MIKKQIKQAMSVFNDVFGNKISWPKTESDDITVNMMVVLVDLGEWNVQLMMK